MAKENICEARWPSGSAAGFNSVVRACVQGLLWDLLGSCFIYTLEKGVEYSHVSLS